MMSFPTPRGSCAGEIKFLIKLPVWTEDIAAFQEEMKTSPKTNKEANGLRIFGRKSAGFMALFTISLFTNLLTESV